MMAEDSESAASQQSLELDDQDTCGIDGDNEEENENMQGYEWRKTAVTASRSMANRRLSACFFFFSLCVDVSAAN